MAGGGDPLGVTPWESSRLRLAEIPPLLWAGAMVVAVVALGIAATTIDAVARVDAAAVRELHGEIALRDIEKEVFTVTDLAGSPMLLVAITAVVTLLLVRRWRAALAVAVAVGLTKLTVAAAKEAVQGHVRTARRSPMTRSASRAGMPRRRQRSTSRSPCCSPTATASRFARW